MPVSAPSYPVQQPQVSTAAPSYPVQQTQAPVSQPVTSGGNAGMLTIPGLEGLQGFMPGENKLSLAVIPVTQQNGQLGFQVIGFAISGPGSNQAAVYALSTPLPGVIDPAQNTLQVDLTNLASDISQAGFIASDQVYSTIRSSSKVIVIDVDMTSRAPRARRQRSASTRSDIITPDGKMQAFSMQQPTQLVIDSQSMRIYMVAFPQMVDAFNSFYGATYADVLPDRLRAAHTGPGADLRAVPGAVPDLLLDLHRVQPVLLRRRLRVVLRPGPLPRELPDPRP